MEDEQENLYSDVKLIDLPNNVQYFGEISRKINNLPNGMGVAKYEDKLFLGEWSCEDITDTIKPSIGCIVTYSSLYRYEGEVELSLGENPVAKGFGQILYKDGSLRCGQFNEGKLNGLGLEIDVGDDQIYLGEFLNDKFSGTGVCYHGNGDVFTGEYSNGFRSGFGEYLSFNGNKCLSYEGKWSKDKLLEALNNENNGLVLCLERANKVSEKALKIYEVFNRSINRRVATIRTKIIKMIIYFSKLDLSKEEKTRLFILQLVESKLYRSGAFPVTPSLSSIKQRINRSIETREKNAFKAVETDINDTFVKQVRESREKTEFSVSMPRLHENSINVADAIEEEEIKKDEIDETEEILPMTPRRAPPVAFVGEVEVESVGKETLTFIPKVTPKAVEVERKRLNSHTSFTTLGSFGKDTQRDLDFEEEELTHFVEKQKPRRKRTLKINSKTKTTVSEVHDFEVHKNIPMRPILESESSKQGYFSYNMKAKNTKTNTKTLNNEKVNRKLYGVRQFISAKFSSQQRSIEEHLVRNEEENIDFIARLKQKEEVKDINRRAPEWRDIYAEALDRPQDNDNTKVSFFEDERVGAIGNRQSLLEKTLEGAFAVEEDDESEVEDDHFDSISRCAELSDTDEVLQRGNFQTVNLVVEQYTEKNISNQNKPRPPLAPPPPPQKQLNRRSHAKPSIPQPPPLHSNINVKERSEMVIEASGVKRDDLVRIVFEKGPKPPLPAEKYPKAPSFAPYPPSIPPAPPSIDPRPPKRPPYPPPI